MKMLCLDGGGIRGVFAVSILQEMEKDFNQPIADLVDLVAGTSTGSIIASSISIKKPMKEVLSGYKKYGKQIFTRQAKIGIFKSIYSDRQLRQFIIQAFGNRKLKDITSPLLIPAVDLTHGRPFVHRSNYGNKAVKDLTIHLWDAVLSSCSAPVYFPPNNIGNDYLSIDGGLWANNPSLVCITEGLEYFKLKLEDIEILSIGTGLQKIDFTIQKDKYWGVKQWLPFQFPSMKVTPKLLDLALQLSSESVSYQCRHLLGSNYIRLNKELGEEVPFDDVTYMDELIQLGQSVYCEQKKVISEFLST
ncbi:patatin-like phospholipase family protein [Sutcliffiella horikoshii]|uniref:Patatin-like phospholipase family protein n=1 Tax=Sutcliffiella horikoshii TaxID=79883 RepID=A0A5D4T8C4_9BACI|nr:CBASS cGAMP-activated phospholipase [Sutcliffiella horikoshii]TYS70354.1 patatin-like phospholipase family protein [Sutcliffiella horikoshii]